MLTPRTFKKICQDPRVADWSDERTNYLDHDGIWLYLAPGWVTEDGQTQIHEWTVKECAYELMCTRYDPEAWVAALQGDWPGQQLIDLLPGG